MPRAAKPPKTLTQRPTGTSKRLMLSEKILIRAEKGTLSVTKTAKKYGVAVSTVQRLFGDVKLENMQREVGIVKEHLADRLYVTADNCVDQVHAALFNASSKDAAIALGILIEKARLMEGDTTQSVGIQGLLGFVNDIPATDGIIDITPTDE